MHISLTPTPASPNTSTSASANTPAPPLGVDLTWYRLLNIASPTAFVISKAVLLLRGRDTSTTWLDLALITFGTFMWWCGHYESLESPQWHWFFHQDLCRPTLVFFRSQRLVDGEQAIRRLLWSRGISYYLLALWSLNAVFFAFWFGSIYWLDTIWENKPWYMLISSLIMFNIVHAIGDWAMLSHAKLVERDMQHEVVVSA